MLRENPWYHDYLHGARGIEDSESLPKEWRGTTLLTQCDYEGRGGLDETIPIAVRNLCTSQGVKHPDEQHAVSHERGDIVGNDG